MSPTSATFCRPVWTKRKSTIVNVACINYRRVLIAIVSSTRWAATRGVKASVFCSPMTSTRLNWLNLVITTPSCMTSSTTNVSVRLASAPASLQSVYSNSSLIVALSCHRIALFYYKLTFPVPPPGESQYSRVMYVVCKDQYQRMKHFVWQLTPVPHLATWWQTGVETSTRSSPT